MNQVSRNNAPANARAAVSYALAIIGLGLLLLGLAMARNDGGEIRGDGVTAASHEATV
jgi:hypothetical protein